MWNKKANTCGYCPATINNGEDGSYRSCEDIMTDWGWTCQEVIDMVGESFCSQCPSCDITADDGDGGDACSGLARKKCKKPNSSCEWKKKACQTKGGSSTCKKQKKKGKCKKTDGCAYKKKKCISCSELSKKKCKKTDGCDYKKKQCSAASSCSGLSKRECKTTDGCKYKKKKDKCLAK